MTLIHRKRGELFFCSIKNAFNPHRHRWLMNTDLNGQKMRVWLSWKSEHIGIGPTLDATPQKNNQTYLIVKITTSLFQEQRLFCSCMSHLLGDVRSRDGNDSTVGGHSLNHCCWVLTETMAPCQPCWEDPGWRDWCRPSRGRSTCSKCLGNKHKSLPLRQKSSFREIFSWFVFCVVSWPSRKQ